MRRLLLSVAILVGAAHAAAAADSMGLPNEQPLAVKGKVVDLLCELRGDCPANCGDGKRQLGLLTETGRLIMPAKGPTLFAGAVVDLLPYCGRTIEADGLLIENPAMTLYMIQYLRESPSQEWKPAEAFIQAWTAAHGAAEEW